MSDEARLQRWLASQRNAAAEAPSSDHIDVEMLTRHAAGQLSGAKARMVNEHLQACDDGRCRAFVHAQLSQAAPQPPQPQPAASRRGIAPEEGVATMTAPDIVLRAAQAAIAGATQIRTFQSREIVWSTFESMAAENGVPVDDLVNAAMAVYAQARGYSPVRQPVDPAKGAIAMQETRATGQPPMSDVPIHDPLAQTNEGQKSPTTALDRSYEHPAPKTDPKYDWDDDLARTSTRGNYARSRNDAGPDSRTTPRRGSFPASGHPPDPPPHEVELVGGPMTHRMPEAPMPPPLPRATGGGGAPVPSAGPPLRAPPVTKRLVLTYVGRAFPVEKERYLIGRSTTQSDLRLDDPNVSRQHAVVEKVGAAWYLVDLGSTNGVHVSGDRVTRRALQDNDIIVITTHQIHVSLR